MSYNPLQEQQVCYTDERRYHSKKKLPISLYLAIRAPRVLRVAKHTLLTIIDTSMYSFIHKPRYLYSLQYSALELEHIKLKVEQGCFFFLKVHYLCFT